jgi:hypothetical protein
MPTFIRSRNFFALACLLLIGPVAYAGDMVAITITNDNTDDVLVTVYDMNTQPPGKLLDGQLINGFASVPISVAAGAGGTGHVSWTATNTDPDNVQCGRKDKPGLTNNASVHVFAHSKCPVRAHRKLSQS